MSEEVAETGSGAENDSGLDTDRAAEVLLWVGIVVLGVTAIVALAGFYSGVSAAIRVWVAAEYRPLVNAAFNLSLLLVALAGIGLLLRRRS
jgi:hypothetical protein